MSSSQTGSSWRKYLEDAAKAGDEVMKLLPENPDERLVGEADRVLAMTFAQAYWMLFHGDARWPEWIPFISFLIPSGAINPDTSYDCCRIDAEGTYRLSGFRGSARLLDFQLNHSMPGLRDHSGARTGGIDGDSLTLDADGRFQVLLSRKIPKGHSGDWRALPPETGSILMRQVRYDWENELDARVAIERLDVPVRQPMRSVSDTRERLNTIGSYITRYQRQFLGYKAQVRALGAANVLHRRVRKETGGAGEGGGMGAQVIYHGNFDLDDDEVLLIETVLPERCHYWNIQVTDEMHLAIDPVFCQTSLNGFQARLDADGKFRAVIAASDPGVPNWLDTSGLKRGGIIGRWTRADSAPMPSTKILKLSELRKHLPAATPIVSPEEREQVLRARCRAAQLRKR